MKYTPSSIFTVEPNPVAAVPRVLAYLTGEPLDVNSSPFANTEVMLFVPELVYFTYKVAGFEASPFATTSITSAVTPVVAPVIVVPTNSDK